MVALQHNVGGLPASELARRTFAQVLALASNHQLIHNSDPPNPNDLAPTGMHKGQPAIFFTPQQVHTLAEPFQWTLVGKFSQGYNNI